MRQVPRLPRHAHGRSQRQVGKAQQQQHMPAHASPISMCMRDLTFPRLSLMVLVVPARIELRKDS